MSAGDFLSKKLFNYVHHNHLVYNQCWEDPRLDRQALEINSKDNMLMITSAGCNALDYALVGPASITTVDMNSKQNALLELKIAGIKNLDYSDFSQLFGKGHHEKFRELYKKQLRPSLSQASQKIWDKWQRFFDNTFFHPSFYFRGSAGLFAQIARNHFYRQGIREQIHQIFTAPNIEEQRRLYEATKPYFWNNYARRIMNQEQVMYLLGVPRPQFHQIQNVYPGGMPKFVEDFLDVVFGQIPLKDNYFWWLYFHGQYDKNCCPEYLTEDGFHKLKSGMVDVIQIHTSTILDHLNSTDSKISKFVLLDHMDWLYSEYKSVLEKEWQALVDHADKNARFIWRSAGFTADFIDSIEVTWQGQKKKVGELLHYHREKAQELHKKDRVHTYGSFYIADLKN